MSCDMRSYLSTCHATYWTYLQSFLSFLWFFFHFYFPQTMNSILMAIDRFTIRICILANVTFERIFVWFSSGNVCDLFDMNFFHVIRHSFQCFQMESAYITGEWKIWIIFAGWSYFTESCYVYRWFLPFTAQTFNRSGFFVIVIITFVIIFLVIFCGSLQNINESFTEIFINIQNHFIIYLDIVNF